MTALSRRYQPVALVAAMAAFALVLAALVLGGSLSLIGKAVPAGVYDADRMVLLYATLPRLAMSLLCGAALGASGAILQQVLRNPLASPTTLGFDAGARLALAVTTLFMPQLFGWGRDLVALGGSAVAASAVFLLTRRQDFAPVPLVLSGLVISLYCGALAAILTLLNDRYLVSLFIWGAGSLSQQGWTEPVNLALRLVPLALLAVLIVRPLQLLDLGEANVRALGMRVGQLRLLAVALSILFSAFVASAVGIIGFVGLVAPVLAQLSGARRFGPRLLVSTILGALLLLLTDCAVQAALGDSAAFLPTGAVTALVGAPLLLALLPRLKRFARPPAAPHLRRSRMAPQARTLALAALGFAFAALLSVFVGRGVDGGWTILSPAEFGAILLWRGPRLLATVAAGVMLGLAGAILQRLTGNELAGPEVLGIGAGATLAVAAALFATASLGGVAQGGAALLGALGVMGAILAFSHRSGFQPERVILTGIALNALLDAVVGVLSASGDPRAVQLLAWMSGSPAGIGWDGAAQASVSAILFAGLALLMLRWLAVAPLGTVLTRALGVPLGGARLSMLLVAGGLTAAATPVLGPLSFIGLMAPHAARTIGLRRPAAQLLGSALIGGAITAVADFSARAFFFPSQLPTGLLAALVGAPFLLILLSRRNAE